ncbi:MAG: alkaline phosphatase family protein [Phycisphaerales bacterium]|nr:alkaline phosphatase family protein [Phycisphaerales bacterium]
MTVFFVDGMDHARFDALLAEGRLPAIKHWFVDGGVGVDYAMSSLPPITYANAVSIITGRFPGHHGILGNRWFDPDTFELRDYGSAATYRAVNDDFTCPTLYDLLDDELTVNVQGHTRRGVKVTFDNWASSGIDWFLGDYSDVDARVADSFAEVARTARRKGRWPAVYFNYFPGVDEVGHRFGSDSPEYADALTVADHAIGEIIAQVEAAAAVEQRYYVLLTDHSHVPTPAQHACDIAEEIHKRFGLTAAERGRLSDADIVLVNGAFRRVALHLGGAHDWDDPPEPERIARLLGNPFIADRGPCVTDIPGVLCACTPVGADAVLVVGKSGWMRVERRVVNGAKEYRVVLPNDATSLDSRSLTVAAQIGDSDWHTSREWLATSADAEWPDFVPQVVEMFDSPRAGDIVLFADSDWTFDAHWRGGHGSCLACDMHVPLFFSGPGLPAGGRIHSGRLVDVMPTVLDMLDHRDRLAGAPPIDGISLLSALRVARPAN